MTAIDLIKGSVWVLMIAYVLLRPELARRRTRHVDAPGSLVSSSDLSVLYGVIAAQLRHVASQRAIYVVVLLLATALFAAVFSASTLASYQRSTVALIALVTSAALLIVQERLDDAARAGQAAARGLEAHWNGALALLGEAESSRLSTADVIRVMHVALAALWMFVYG